MVKLAFDLDAISDDPYDTGTYRAKLKMITKTRSRDDWPMLVFQWLIITGPNKDLTISSYASLRPSYLSSLKEHLEGLGLSGEIDRSSDDLLGRQALLVLTSQESDREDRDKFVSVSQVLPDLREPLT
jgi:hypothetical protein